MRMTMPFNYSLQSAQEHAFEMLNQIHLMNGVCSDELRALVIASIHPITTASLLTIMGENHLLDRENLMRVKETLEDVRDVRETVTLNMIQNQPKIKQEIEKFLADQEAIKKNFEKSAGSSVSHAADSSSPFRMS